RALAEGEWWQAAAPLQRRIRREPARAELAAAGDGAGEGAAGAAVAAEAERGGALVEVESVALGRSLEPVDEVAHEPRGRRAEDAKPEALDVAGPRVVADLVDDRIGPGKDLQAGDGGRDVAGVHCVSDGGSNELPTGKLLPCRPGRPDDLPTILTVFQCC